MNPCPRPLIAGFFVVAGFALIAPVDAAIPFEFEPLTSADAARPVRVAMDGDVAAVIEVGFSDTSGNIKTYHRESTTNWVEVGMLPAPGNVLSVDLDACFMALGTTGRVDTWYLTCDQIKPTWFKLDSVILTNSSYRVVDVKVRLPHLAMLVAGEVDFESDRRVYIYGFGATSWLYRAQITITNSGDVLGGGSIVTAMSLSGERLAVSSPQQIRIHEKDAGGINNWGAVAMITNRPAGTGFLGYSLALDNNRLAASVFHDLFVSSSVLVYSNNTGGVGNWGLAGTLLSQPPNASILNLDARYGSLAVLGLPLGGDSALADKSASLRVYGAGAGPGGWSLLREQSSGAMKWFQSSFFFGDGSLLPHPSITSNRVIVGVIRTNTLRQVAGWGASIHQAHVGGANQWGVEQFIGVKSRPHGFGDAVAMHGNFLVTGMPGDDWAGTNTGSAYVWYLFDTDTFGGGWIPLARLTSGTGEISNRFGAAVAIYQLNHSRARVVVGAPGIFSGKGEAHVFDVDINTGQLAPGRTITPIPYDNDLQFGSSVAIWSNRLAVGAPGRAGGAGAVYLFERDIGGVGMWGPLRTNTPPTSGVGFGARIDMVGNALAVSRPFTNGVGRRVFIYRRDQGGANQWGLVATLAPPAGSPPGFGESVAMPTFMDNPFVAAIGATGSGGSTGVVHIMGAITSAVWEVIQTIPGPAADGPSFGSSVSWMGILNLGVGAPLAGTGGRVRFYEWSLTNVSMLAMREGAAGDQMGRSIAGDTIYLAAGAPLNDTNGVDAGVVRSFRVGSYELWAGTQPAGFVTTWLPKQDWDGDGDDNLLEFAMGTDPMNPASNSKFIMRRERQGFTDYMGWLRPTLAYNTSLLDYNIEGTFNLANWFSSSYATSLTNGSLRLYPASSPLLHYRLNPRYPVFSEAGDGGGGPIILQSQTASPSGGIAPSPGHDLVFPAAAARQINTNHFAGTTYFNRLRIPSPRRRWPKSPSWLAPPSPTPNAAASPSMSTARSCVRPSSRFGRLAKTRFNSTGEPARPVISCRKTPA